MIVIAKKVIELETAVVVEPERLLTKDEEAKVIARWGDEAEYWYFTEDDKKKNTAKWKAFIAHTTPEIINESDQADETVLGLLGKMSPEGIAQIKEFLK